MPFPVFTEKTPINDGWSGDEKYRVTDENGTPHLLRISPSERSDVRKIEFGMMPRLAAMGLPMSVTTHLEIANGSVSSLSSWIDGRNMRDVIGGFTETQKYDCGLRAGRILRQIHSIPAPGTEESWGSRFGRKLDRKIGMYLECSEKYEGGEHFLRYIDENRRLIENRPQTFQHGDYHVGNFMIDNNGELVIIDFASCGFGDPWEEFNRIIWSLEASVTFANGIIDGYFGGEPPLDFWRLLALYISSNTLSSLPWGVAYGGDQPDIMKAQAEKLLFWYDNMTTPIPRWRTGGGI